ncbi:Pre-mRNA-splicing factor PRP9 [Meyerozyma sp. JA9]|nr:Pre-mRNA-splicing factor PRP9 [Meyerozyma sp. JA9]
MSGYIELQRSLLEESDIIEDAIAQRVRRNVDVVPAEVRPQEVKDLFSTRKRPLKELVQQQHEVSYFLDKCKRQKQAFLDAKNDPAVDEELKRLEDSSGDFVEFDKMLDKIVKHYEIQQKEPSAPQDIAGLYRMYSSAPATSIATTRKNKIKTKRKYILSAVAAHLTADSLFTPEECYGKYFDLRDLHAEYQHFAETSYRDFLVVLQDLKRPANADPKAYVAFVQKLAKYLQSFYGRKYPFRDPGALLSEIATEFSSEAPSEEDPLYCESCDKRFAKESVFTAHLTGKKHKKNAQRSSENDPVSSSLFEEFKARKLCEALAETLANTITNVDRQTALTEREKQIEGIGLADDDSEDTVVQSTSGSDDSSDSDREESAFANMPLGADGTPIPPWLYKLQGLHRSYDCEVCGNISYKGRVAYNKHFGGAKHVQGLKLLGVDDDSIPLFKSISTIDEAVSLWRKIKRANRIEEGERENAVEVEDEAGNVMSRKDYLDLKKQGLL